MSFIGNLLARIDAEPDIDIGNEDGVLVIEPRRDLIELDIEREDKLLAWATDQKTALEAEIANATERLRQVNVMIDAHSGAKAMLEAARA